jgi:uncharacterized protein YwgA
MASVKLLACLNAVGQGFDLAIFEDRLALQKVTYLIQRAGVKLGYGFSWYLRGPYSPSLTKDAYELTGLNSKNLDLPKLEADDADRIKRVSSLVGKIQSKSEPREYWLELLASLDFVANRFAKGRSDGEVVSLFRKKKPKFPEEDVLEGIQLLREFRA